MPRRRDLSTSPKASQLDLAARFVQALYAATGGRYARLRPIVDVAARAGITRQADIDRAVATAVAADFLVVTVDDRAVMLTDKGIAAARLR